MFSLKAFWVALVAIFAASILRASAQPDQSSEFLESMKNVQEHVAQLTGKWTYLTLHAMICLFQASELLLFVVS